MFVILKELFPCAEIKKDVHIGEQLYIDFVVKGTVDIGVEYDGEQHFTFNTRFHTTKADLEAQQSRDSRKDQLAEEKNIVLIRVRFDEPLEFHFIANRILWALEQYELDQESDFNTRKKKNKEYRNQKNKEAYRKKKEFLKTGGINGRN